MNNQNKLFGFKIKHLILILMVLSIITGLSFGKYAKFSFDLDEIFTVSIGKNINPLNYWDSLNQDFGNPPLFFILLKPLALIRNLPEIYLRILPLVFYLLSVWVFIKILIKFKISENLRLLTIIIYLGLAPFWFFRFYLRVYSLLLFLVLLTIYQSFKLLKNHRSLAELKRLMIIIFFGFHAHYTYWVFAAIWLLTLFLTSSVKKILNISTKKKIIKIISISSITLFPVIFNLVLREFVEDFDRYSFWQLESASPSFFEIFEFILKIDLHHIEIFKLVGFLFWLMIIVGGILVANKKTNKNQQLWLVFSSLFWLIYFLTPLKNFLSVFRYVAVFTLFVPISLILILNELLNLDRYLKIKTIMLMSTLILVAWSLLPPLEGQYRLDYRDNWKTVIEMISENQQNYVLVVDCVEKIALDHYLTDINFELYGFAGFSSGDVCELPSVVDNAENLNDILVVGDNVVPLPIEDTHVLDLHSEKFYPIKLYFYSRKQ